MASYIPTLVQNLWSANPTQVTKYLCNAKYTNLKAFANLDGDLEEPEEDEELIFLSNMNSLGADEASTVFLLRLVSQKCLQWLKDGCDSSTMSILLRNLTFLASTSPFSSDDESLTRFKTNFPLALLFAATSDESLMKWVSLVIAMSSSRRISSKKSFRHNALELKKWTSLVWRKFENSRVEGFETDFTDMVLESNLNDLVEEDIDMPNSFQGYTHSRVIQSYKQTKYDTTFFEALFTHCGSVADALIQCAYHRHIRYPPTQQTYNSWIRAVQCREIGDDESADHWVKQAFDTEFWLPLRYAALFSFKPSYPILLPRIEYEAVLTIASVDRRAVPDDIYRVVSAQCSVKTFNPECKKSCIWWNKSCAHAGSGGCCNYVPCGTPICSAKHRVTYDNDIPNMSILPENPCDWDPSIWTNGIVCWKLPDSSFYFQKNSSTELYFGIDKFNVISPEFERLLVAMSSNEEHFSAPVMEDVFQCTHALKYMRNNSFRISTPITLVDAWDAVTCAISFCHVAKKQSEKWTYGTSGSVDLPPSNTISTLALSTDQSLKALYSLLQSFLPPVIDNLMTDFDRLMIMFNGFHHESPVSMLICPPENLEGYAGTFAGIPWTSVLDLSESSFSTPSIWSTMDEFIAQGVFRPGRHVHLSSRARVRGPMEITAMQSIIANYSYMSPCGLPWFQPLLDEVGNSRAQFDVKVATEEDTIIIDRIKNELKKLAMVMLQKAAASISKELLLVLPMNGLFGFPISFQHKGQADACSFLKVVSNDRGVDDTMINYSFGPLVQTFLHAISTNDLDVRTKLVLLVDDMSDENSKCLNWIRSSINNEHCQLVAIKSQPHLFDTMFKWKVSDSIPVEKGVICLIAGTEEFPLSKKFRPFDGIPQDADFPSDITIENESRQYLGKLKNAGLDLLYTKMTEDCLKVTANKLLQSKRSQPIGVVENDYILPALYRSALDFAAGGVPSWALFDRKLTDPCNMSALVISREISRAIERDALELWRHAAGGRHVNILTLLTAQGSGGSTLARRFAYDIAFRSWGAAVFDMSSAKFPQGILEEVFDLIEVCAAITSSSEQASVMKPVVFLADRNVSDDRVLELLSVLQSPTARAKRFCALVVRVRSRGEVSRIVSNVLHGDGKLIHLEVPTISDNECKMIRTVIQSFCGSDINIQSVTASPAIFRRVFGMLSFGSCGEGRDSTMFKAALEQIMINWVDGFVDSIYQSLESDHSGQRRSALMVVWCIALLQLSGSECCGFSPKSFLPILRCPASSLSLYDSFTVSGNGLFTLEEGVMNQVYSKLCVLQKKFHQLGSALIPLLSMIEPDFLTEVQPEKNSFSGIASQLSRQIGTKFRRPVDAEEKSDSWKTNSSWTEQQSVIDFIRQQFKLITSSDDEGLLDIFLLTTPEDKLMFASEVVAERFLDTCMKQELQKASMFVSPDPPSPYYMLVLKITKAFADESTSTVQDSTSTWDSYHGISHWLPMVFAERKDSNESELSCDYSWVVGKINDSLGSPEPSNFISDNKTLLTLLAGLALYPTNADIYCDISRILIESNWTVNVTDTIYNVRQQDTFNTTTQSLSTARLLLCSSLAYSSMSIRFSTNVNVEKSEAIESLMLNTLQLLTLDARSVLQQGAVPAIKSSILSTLPPDLLDVSNELSIPPNVLYFLLSLVADYLLFANVACFHMKSQVYKGLGGLTYIKCAIEGLQEIVASIVTHRLNDTWVKFYRMLILHDSSKQMDKQKKKYQLADSIIDQVMDSSDLPVNGTNTESSSASSAYDIICVDDLLNKVVDIVYTTRAMGDLDSTSDLLEQIFYWEAVPFNIPGDLSYQNSYRHLFHLEKNALERMSSADMRSRGMMRLARVSHWIFSSNHNESNERSRLMQCLMLESPDLISGDLPAMIKALYESGNQKKCPSAFIADMIDLSTFSNKNELGRVSRPISITNLELIVKQQFYRLPTPTPNSMSSWLLHKRNYLSCLFVQLWGLVAWGQKNGHVDNGSMKNIWNEFVKWNGTFDDQTQTWNPGQHDYVSGSVGSLYEDDEVTLNDDVLVFTRPGDMDWCNNSPVPPVTPCLLRRKFADIDEANVELGEEELFVLQPVYGTIVYVNSSHGAGYGSNDYFSGYVCVEGMRIFLPFFLTSEYEISLLESSGKNPTIYQRCSFYVGFKRTKAYAFLIQRAEDDNDRVSYYDMLHAERIARSNNLMYQPRTIRERPFRPRMLMNSDGLNFMDYSMKATPVAEVQKVFSLADSDYSDLTKDYKETASTPIQLLTAKEFDMDSLESMVGLQRRIYGRLNFLCSALHTPYEGFDVQPNKATGWIAVPVSRSSNGVSESKSLFPWIEKNIVDPDFMDKQIHWIARDVVSLFVDKALKFGASKPTRKVSPQKLDLIESATEGFCRKMFLLVALPKLSLVAVPKGILVLREQSQGGTGHFFDLGILYFDNKTVLDTRNYLTTIWKRAVGCILSSNWQYLGDNDPSIDDSVENIAKRVVTTVDEPVVEDPVNVKSTTSATSPVFSGGLNTVAPSLSMGGIASGIGGAATTTPSLGELSFFPSSQHHLQQNQSTFFMDMSTPSSLVEPLFPSATSSATTSPPQKTASAPISYLGVIGKGGMADPAVSISLPPKSHPPGSFASVLADAASSAPSSSNVVSTPTTSVNSTSSAVKRDTSKQSTVSSKFHSVSSLDGRHGDFKVFVKNLKDFSVNEIQEILGNDVRSITLKLTNKQPNGMCHMTFKTKNGYLTALNRNYEVIAPSINLSISKDTSNDSKFNIDNPVYFTYDEEESVNYDSSVLAQPSEISSEVGGSSTGGRVLQSSLTGEHGDYYAFVRGLFYYNSYEVQSFLGDDVRSVTLKLDDDGRPNGMSHVTFNTQDGFNAAIGRNNEYIRGKQQLRIAPDTKKDFGNGSCRTIYFIRPFGASRAAKEKRKARGKKASTSLGNAKVSGGKSTGQRGGNLYGAFDDDDEWQTK